MVGRALSDEGRYEDRSQDSERPCERRAPAGRGTRTGGAGAV